MNLSQYKLNITEKQLLSHGLQFIPAPKKIDRNAIIDGATEFSLRTRRQFFFNKKNKLHKQLPFLPPSDWEPPHGAIPKEVHDFLNQTIKEAKEMDLPTPTTNLPDNQQRSLTKLSKDLSIVIKQADKGSAIVIMDRTNYIKEADRQLSNPTFYKEIPQPIFKETAKTFARILKELENLYGEVGGKNQDGICGINEKQCQFLMPPCEDHTRQRIFYLLPKIHKDPAKWPTPNLIPPGRPIVSDCSSEGYNIAAFIDYFLQPIACSHKAYLKDTNHFLEMIKSTEATPNCLIVTADVDAMYTNIDHQQGLASIRKALEKNPPTTDNPRIPDEYLLQLLEISLTQNDFHFNGKTYLQIKGTSMGKKFAPAYANIFMAEWEEKILSEVPTKPEIWKRFLDDCFLIWLASREELTDFFNILNNDNPSIKLKYEVSDTHVEFLDTTVFKGDDIETTHRLSTKLFRKPTDTMELLHKESFHPPHTFAGIIKSQVLRYNRICTNKKDFDDSCTELFKALAPRGYTRTFLDGIKKKTLKEIQEPKSKGLSRSPFNVYLSPPDKTHESKPCGSNRCEACPHITTTTTFTSTATKTTYPLHHSLDCSSTDVVYLITCTRCQQQYVGETSQELRQRLHKYRNRIERTEPTFDLTMVEEHFRPENNHNGMEDISIIPIAQRPNLTRNHNYGMFLRQSMEEFWIEILQTKEPQGLNTKFRGQSSILPLVTPFSETTRSWANSSLRKWRQQIRPVFRHILPNRTLAAFRRNRNLRDRLCSSALPRYLFQITAQELQEQLEQELTEQNIETLNDLLMENEEEDECELELTNLTEQNIEILSELLMENEPMDSSA